MRSGQDDFNFADNIALASDTAEHPALLIIEVERHCRRIGLQLKAKKRQVMPFNSGDIEVKTLGGTKLEVVQVIGCLDSICGEGH